MLVCERSEQVGECTCEHSSEDPCVLMHVAILQDCCQPLCTCVYMITHPLPSLSLPSAVIPRQSGTSLPLQLCVSILRCPWFLTSYNCHFRIRLFLLLPRQVVPSRHLGLPQHSFTNTVNTNTNGKLSSAAAPCICVYMPKVSSSQGQSCQSSSQYS